MFYVSHVKAQLETWVENSYKLCVQYICYILCDYVKLHPSY